MADANGSGTPAPPTDDDGPIQRSPEEQEVLDAFFPETPDTTIPKGGRGW